MLSDCRVVFLHASARLPRVDVLEQPLQARDLLVGRRRVNEFRVDLLPHCDFNRRWRHHVGLMHEELPHVGVLELLSLPEANEVTSEFAQVGGRRFHLLMLVNLLQVGR